ncbi:MAG: hypothetical protein Q9210_002824 [Variospora velana]
MNASAVARTEDAAEFEAAYVVGNSQNHFDLSTIESRLIRYGFDWKGIEGWQTVSVGEYDLLDKICGLRQLSGHGFACTATMVIHLGIIGLSADQSAWANMAHVQAIKPGGPLAHQYKLTALATSKPESATAAAEFHGVPVEKAYSKPEDIASDPDVDMVVVSVQVPMHKQLAMPALHAKKDVFVEWPLGANLAEAEEMAALAKKQGVKTYVCLQTRLQPALVKAKELVASGALGRIISTTVLGIDSQMIDFPEKARYINDPDSAQSPTLPSPSSPPQAPNPPLNPDLAPTTSPSPASSPLLAPLYPSTTSLPPPPPLQPSNGPSAAKKPR